MASYLDELNPQQRAAVEYMDGTQLVIAGAGSGKTRVLTYKIVHLLALGYEPWRLMALTFTNKAAQEMKERVMALTGGKGVKISMGTFHSIFARILRANADRIGFKPNFTIYDKADSQNLLKKILKTLEVDEKVYKVSSVANDISRAKNALIVPEVYLADPGLRKMDAIHQRPLTGHIYMAYRDRCRLANAMDFDDLLLYTNILFRDNPDIRRHYSELFRYILVDEYQDTNLAQHAIIRMLSTREDGTPYGNLFVVGDDAQSIYSFRGANITNILSLQRSFPDLEIFKLEQNYRSTQNIVNAAGSLIEKNTEQIPKNVYSKSNEGSKVEVVKSYSDFEESALVTNKIVQIKRSVGANYNDIAILYRTNAQSRVLEESLRKRNIPYRIYGGQSFYQRKEVKDAVAYCRLALNPSDEESLLRVLNVPLRGIGEVTAKKIIYAASEAQIPAWSVLCDPLAHGVKVNRGTIEKLQRFANLVKMLQEMVENNDTADKVVAAACLQTGLIAQYLSDNTPENVSRLENLNSFMAGAHEFVEDQKEAGLTENVYLADFLSVVSLATDSDESDEDERVTLMTIHAAKGLEYDNVFVVGVEEDLLPSSMSKDSPREVEEERRLLYVAITRAKKYCMLSYASSRFRNGMTALCTPSRFLSEIDSRYLNFVSGSNVSPSTAFSRSRTNIYSSAPGYPHRSVFNSSQASTIKVQQSPQSSRAITPSHTATDVKYVLHSVNELTTGMEIEHQRFGRGRIAQIDATNPSGARIVVNFANTDMRTLLLSFARFAIIH